MVTKNVTSIETGGKSKQGLGLGWVGLYSLFCNEYVLSIAPKKI